jgi:hypothetical protein
MGKMQRDKGQRGEREIVAMFVEAMEAVEKEKGVEGSALSEMVKRNTLQSDRGGFDVANIPTLAVEVKRAEVLNVNSWWNQTLEQCKQGETPVLFYRQSRKPWRCVCMTALCDRHGKFISYVRSDILATDFVEAYKVTYARFLTIHKANAA